MDDGQPVAVLEELLATRGEHLLRTAVLLAGSHADGEDLLQAALERVFRRWRTISGDPEGYLRRTLYHLAADGWRRKRAWRDRLPLLGSAEAQPDSTGAVDQRDHLVRLLRKLPPQQRTAVTHPEGTSFPAPGTGDVPVTEVRTQYRWLALTTVNLAQLTVPVPPGFQQVSTEASPSPSGGA
jgi:DNA-directed RNA polymerase specialized sigma24 family protein